MRFGRTAALLSGNYPIYHQMNPGGGALIANAMGPTIINLDDLTLRKMRRFTPHIENYLWVGYQRDMQAVGMAQ